MSEEEVIRKRANEIWEAEGRPEGRELDHWFQAKEETTAYKALGLGEYSAYQNGSKITIKANGTLPSGSFRATLEPNRIEPGQDGFGNAFVGYMLIFRRHSYGPAGEPQPFEVQAEFEYRGSVFEVVVIDRKGLHTLYPNGAPSGG